jgi:lactoylglutathione lyase
MLDADSSTSGAASSTQTSTTPTTDPSTPTPWKPVTEYPLGAFLPNGLHTDPPPSPATQGYKLNHFMLRIRDPAASLPFYISLLGMRTVFTMNTGPFTIYYLGYPQTAAHAQDLPQFGRDTCAHLQHTLGLLELYHVHGSEAQSAGYYATGNTPPALGFGHLGFTVPDVPAALERMRKAGVTVVKEVGKGTTTRRAVPISEAEEEVGVGLGEIHEEYAKVFDHIGFVNDPDGYLVELVPQGMDPLKP